MENSSFDIKKTEQSHQKNNKNKTTSYIPTKNYVYIRPNKHNESPKSKATFIRAANTNTKGENIYRKIKLERDFM
jgi:hypothetical protein